MSWKKAVLVALVVLLVLIGLPFLMPGMSGAATACHDCAPAVAGGATCTLVGVLAAAVLAIALLAQAMASRREDLIDLLLAAVFDRPPQTV